MKRKSLAVIAALVISCSQISVAYELGVAHAFSVFNNTKYTNVTDKDLGVKRSNLVGEPQLPELSRGVMPNETRFKSVIKENSSNPGPLILDFEHLNLNGSHENALNHLEMLKELAKWTHDAVPGKVVGFYGFPGAIDAKNHLLGKDLVKSVDAFFPSMYTFDNDRVSWLRRLKNYVALAKTMDPNKKIFIFLWPQYYYGNNGKNGFVDSNLWKYQLDAARGLTDGVIIWSKRVNSSSNGWIDVTKSFSHPP